MDDLIKPLINLVPDKWRSTLTILAVLSPYLTRGYHSLKNGGGLRGVVQSIWFGTNVPKEVKEAVSGTQQFLKKDG